MESLSFDREFSWSGAKPSGSSVVLGEKMVQWGDFGIKCPQGWALFLFPSWAPNTLKDPNSTSPFSSCPDDTVVAVIGETQCSKGPGKEINPPPLGSLCFIGDKKQPATLDLGAG